MMLEISGTVLSGMDIWALAVAGALFVLGCYLGMNLADTKAKARSMGLSGWERFFPQMPGGNQLLEGTIMVLLVAGIVRVLGEMFMAFMAFLHEAASSLMFPPGEMAVVTSRFSSFMIVSDFPMYVFAGIASFATGFFAAILFMAIQHYRFEKGILWDPPSHPPDERLRGEQASPEA